MAYEHPEILVFSYKGRELATTLAAVPRVDEHVLIENNLLGAHTYRVVRVLRTYSDAEDHVSAAALAAGGIFQVTPRRVHVSLELDKQAPAAT